MASTQSKMATAPAFQLTFEHFQAEEIALRKQIYKIVPHPMLFSSTPLYTLKYPEIEGIWIYQTLEPGILTEREKRERAAHRGALFTIYLQEVVDQGVRWGYKREKRVGHSIYVWSNLSFSGCPEKYQRDIADWLRHVRDTHNEPFVRARQQARTRKFKEELMMNRWHPSRVEKYLDMGLEIEDM